MRRKIVAGNWKMNKCLYEAESLFSQILEFKEDFPGGVNVIIAPPYLYLSKFSKAVKNVGGVDVSAQNCAYEQEGAYTGEVSPEMLKSVGVEYAIIGHSERRSLFCENDNTLAAKVKAALRYKVNPIFCVGEQLSQRESGSHFDTVSAQLEAGLASLSSEELAAVVVAYEPVWAIGTGKTASAEQAQEMHAHIRNWVADRFSAEAAEGLSILYGGSVKPDNASELFACPDVDGGLIGGASLKAGSFIEIVKAAG